MISGDTSAIELMEEDYYVAFFHTSKGMPMIFSKSEAVLGMKESVKELIGAKKKFENRVIRLKNNSSATVFYELKIEKENVCLAHMFTIEDWEIIEGKWMLVREIENRIL